MANTQNTATVRDFLDAAWNRGDTSVIDHTVAEHHIEHEPDGDEVRLADGQINESWSMFDQIGLLLQLGVIQFPAPEETST
jgi:hypothetical protein